MSDVEEMEDVLHEIDEGGLTLQEIDNLIQTEKIDFSYTLSDAILFLLYADRKPIKGKIKQQKEVFLALKLVLDKLPLQPIHFKKHRFGPYSEEVDHTIDQLVFSNHLEVAGKKTSNDFAIQISPNGMSYIKNKFNQLSPEIQEDLQRKREQWDTHSPQGILNVVYTHFPEYLENSVLKNRYEQLDWTNDKQEPPKK
jgi:uncharacterized protein YwgA